MTILVLGGTAEARELAGQLHRGGASVVSSLAGRVARPRLPVGRTRVGGFGGVGGLAAYVRDEHIDAVVDATHPFAHSISANAVHACAECDVPLLRLARPGWADEPGASRWQWVNTHAEAAAAAARLGARPLLTVGRQPLDAFGVLAEYDTVVRVVDAVDDVPRRWTVIRDRGPYTFDAERALMESHLVDVLVTKDSGGTYTRPKLDAADALDIPVVVVRRPVWPEAQAAVGSVADAFVWASRWITPRPPHGAHRTEP
ncbi:MAG: cobalt-precorrin-6A reductase [Nocardioidaceae bacterium]